MLAPAVGLKIFGFDKVELLCFLSESGGKVAGMAAYAAPWQVFATETAQHQVHTTHLTPI